MFARRRKTQPRGVVAVLLVVSIFALMGFLALSIDLGMMAMTRAQLQDVSDAAAMAGCRALNGNTTGNANNNYAAVAPTATAVATANTVLGANVGGQPGQRDHRPLGLQQHHARLSGRNSPARRERTGASCKRRSRANISSQLPFSKLLGFTGGNVQVTSTAIHRPRDIAVILDYSGSMRFASLLGIDYETITRASNNPDTNIPVWGHYSDVGDAGLVGLDLHAPLQRGQHHRDDQRRPAAGGSGLLHRCQRHAGLEPGPVELCHHARGRSVPQVSKNTGSSYATCPADLLNINSPTGSSRDANFESQGYAAYSMEPAGSVGYSQGPGYWGKTFFLWPPDPTNDWRKLYFTYPDGVTPMDDNSRLWDTNGNWQAPGPSTYAINYTAILNWIQNIGPNPFPSSCDRAGSSTTRRFPPRSTPAPGRPADLNQRFWKDYIDYCLGLIQLSSEQLGSDQQRQHRRGGLRHRLRLGQHEHHPQEQPDRDRRRPTCSTATIRCGRKLHFWFGPLTMVDCLGNYNVWYDVNPNLLAVLLVARHLPRIADVRVQAGNRRRDERHPEQPSQRLWSR